MLSVEDISESENQNYYKKFIKCSIVVPAQLAINRFSRCPSEANYLNLKKHRELISEFSSHLEIVKKENVSSSVDADEAMHLLNQFMIEVDAELTSSKTLQTVTPHSLYTDTIEDASEKNEFLKKQDDLSKYKHLITYNKIQLEGMMSILVNKINNITKDSTDSAELEELKTQLQTVRETYENFKDIVKYEHE